MVEIAVFVAAAAIIIVPTLMTKPKAIQYEERDFLNGKLSVPKD